MSIERTLQPNPNDTRYVAGLKEQLRQEIGRYKYCESEYEKDYCKSVIYRLMKHLGIGEIV